MPTQQINGFAMSYRDEGDGEPVVLIHGFPLSSRIFDAQADVLRKSHRVITPDLRGFGLSHNIDRFTINSLADDVHELLGKLGARPCVLGGLSMGGYVAQSLVRDHPSDVTKLILLNTKAEGDSPAARAGRNKMIELCRKSGSAAVAKEMLPKMLAKVTLEKNPALVETVVKMMEDTSALTIQHALEALRDRDDQNQFIGTIRIPTLLITGDGDALTGPDVMEPVHKAIIGSKYVVISNAGHLSTMENQSAVTAQMQSFLNEKMNS